MRRARNGRPRRAVESPGPARSRRAARAACATPRSRAFAERSPFIASSISSAAARISGCALGAQRSSKKFSHSVALTMTVCHRNGSKSRLSSCLCTSRSNKRCALRHGGIPRAQPDALCLLREIAGQHVAGRHSGFVLSPLQRNRGIFENALDQLRRRDCARTRAVSGVVNDKAVRHEIMVRALHFDIVRLPHTHVIDRLDSNEMAHHDRDAGTLYERIAIDWIPLTASSALRLHVAMFPGLSERPTASSSLCQPSLVKKR